MPYIDCFGRCVERRISGRRAPALEKAPGGYALPPAPRNAASFRGGWGGVGWRQPFHMRPYRQLQEFAGNMIDEHRPGERVEFRDFRWC